jgi:streptogramin lyase
MTPSGSITRGRNRVARYAAVVATTAATLVVALPATASVGDITEFDGGTAETPYSITSDGSNLWFTDLTRPGVGEMSPTGGVQNFTSGISANAQPYGIAVDGTGNVWFTESGTNAIGELVPSSNNTVTEFPLTGGADPEGITLGPDGNLWFTEAGIAGIGRITPAGKLTQFINVLTTGAVPQGITVGSDGNLWFTETGLDQVGAITTDGTVVGEYPISSGAAPEWITAGPDGALWFTESSANKVGRITTAADDVREFSTGLTASADPDGITQGPDGNLWFTEFSGNAIGRITPAGVITEFTSGLSGSNLRGITSGPDANIWFAESSFGNIGRLALGPPKVGGLSISVTAGTITATHAVTVSGTLTGDGSPRDGSPVDLFAKTYPATTYTKVASAITDANGAVSEIVKPLKKTSYEWRFAGDDTVSAVTSATKTVQVRTKLSDHFSATKLSHTRPLVVWGTTTPNKSGATIDLQRHTSSGYKNVASTKVKSDGTYLFQKFLAASTYSLRVMIPAATGNLSGTTSAVKVVIT